MFHAKNVNFWCFWRGYPMLWWVISKLWWGRQLFRPTVSGALLMAKLLSYNFSRQICRFLVCFFLGCRKFGYKASLKLSAATSQINANYLLSTSTIVIESFRTMTKGSSTLKWLHYGFRCLGRWHYKFVYMVSIQFSAATWMINTKTSLGSSTVPTKSLRNMTKD